MTMFGTDKPRQLTDSWGCAWWVWEGDSRIGTSADGRVVRERRLYFSTDLVTRALDDWPKDWRTLTGDQLEQLCSRATPTEHVPRPQVYEAACDAANAPQIQATATRQHLHKGVTFTTQVDAGVRIDSIVLDSSLEVPNAPCDPFAEDETAQWIRRLVSEHLDTHYPGRHLELSIGQPWNWHSTEAAEDQFEMLDRLARTVDYRDDETAEHMWRVGELSAQLAQAVGLSAADVDMIHRAAPLHDIGKVGIPDRILMKPGPLTDAEAAIMRRHTIIGGELLCNPRSAVVKVAGDIALHHHERWDGTGYPLRLAADRIPEAARIVAIADFYDALTRARPYRPAIPVSNVRRMMCAESGRHFDPRLLEAFVTCCLGRDEGPELGRRPRPRLTPAEILAVAVDD